MTKVALNALLSDSLAQLSPNLIEEKAKDRKSRRLSYRDLRERASGGMAWYPTRAWGVYWLIGRTAADRTNARGSALSWVVRLVKIDDN